MPFEPLLPTLRELNTPGPERVGFILKSGELVELENICPDAEEGFEVRGEDLVRYMDEVAATWHTHPGASSCLSTNDREGFRNYPDWTHLIVGEDGVRAYTVAHGIVTQNTEWLDAG